MSRAIFASNGSEMEFSEHVWLKNDILMSGNAMDLWLTGASGEVAFSLKVEDMSVSSSEEITFVLLPDTYGRINLDMRKILEGAGSHLRCDISGFPGDVFEHALFLKRFTLTAHQGDETASISRAVVCGGSPDEGETSALLSSEYFWTRRPQVAPTWINSMETLCLLPLPDVPGRLCAKLYSRMLPPVLVFFAQWDMTPYSERGMMALLMYDCSLRHICEAASAAGYGERIEAYDIIRIDGDGDVGQFCQRFIVKDGAVHTFLFRNSLGGYDTIHAVADRKKSMESESVLFVSGMEEMELKNDHYVSHEDGSGYLGSRDEVNFWYEFLSSDERYIVLDGKRLRIIVEESDSEMTENSVTSLTFSWHFAKEPEGFVQRRNVLDELYIPHEI